MERGGASCFGVYVRWTDYACNDYVCGCEYSEKSKYGDAEDTGLIGGGRTEG